MTFDDKLDLSQSMDYGLARHLKRFDPNQPRDPKGESTGGQFAASGSGKASNSVIGNKVKHNGATYFAESVDGDDSFPPAVATYTPGDGYVFYRGRNGSEGVVVGSETEIAKWMSDVNDEVAARPLSNYAKWTEQDGGGQYVARAKTAASKAAKAFGLKEPDIEFGVMGSSSAGGEHGSRLVIFNAHKNDPSEFNFKTSATKGEHVAAHEVMHQVYSQNPELGKQLMQRLAKSDKSISLYQHVGSNFEGLMDLGAAYVVSPNELKAYSSELHSIAHDWNKAFVSP